MLEGEDGELDAIVVSDGGIEESYDQSVQVAQELKDMGVNLYFIHIRSSAPSQSDKSRNYYAEKLMKEIGLEGNYQHIDMARGQISYLKRLMSLPKNLKKRKLRISGNIRFLSILLTTSLLKCKPYKCKHHRI
jgi:hypothetical protein